MCIHTHVFVKSVYIFTVKNLHIIHFCSANIVTNKSRFTQKINSKFKYIYKNIGTTEDTYAQRTYLIKSVITLL